jgi:hypothetical protein
MSKKFSERIGAIDTVPTIQTEGMSDELRNSIWNVIHLQYNNVQREYWISLAKWIAQFFRKVPVDELPFRDYDCRKWIKAYFYELEWYEVYDLVEFLVENNQSIVEYSSLRGEQLANTYNVIFKRELSGYRFISGILVPISNPAETAEIAGAIEATSRFGLAGAHQHLETAMVLLGKKPEPDYRNSIKEAISAIESVAKQISGSDARGLVGALAALEKRIELHGALKSAFIKMYGYTSDEDGIRHAILDEANVGFDEAKYMIVTCSAFANYLVSKSSASGLFVNE